MKVDIVAGIAVGVGRERRYVCNLFRDERSNVLDDVAMSSSLFE